MNKSEQLFKFEASTRRYIYAYTSTPYIICIIRISYHSLTICSIVALYSKMLAICNV